MPARIDWRGDEVKKQIAAACADALTEFDMRVEAAAKQELYPGHGKRTGTLQRAIQGEAARVEGDRVVGSIGVKGVVYALVIERLYQYIHNGFEKVRPTFGAILRSKLP